VAVTFTLEQAEEANTAWADPETVGAAFTPANNSLLFVVLALVDSATAFDTALSGGGYTWNNARAGHELSDTNFHWLEEFYALVVTGVSTTLSADQTEAITGGVGWCGELAGHHATTPIKQSAHSDEAVATTPNLSLGAAPDSDSLCIYDNQLRRTPTGWTPEAGWTTDADASHATPNHGLLVCHTTTGSDQIFTATGTNFVHHDSIFEIDAAAAGGAVSRAEGRRYAKTRSVILGLLQTPVMLRSWSLLVGSDGHISARETWRHPLREVILATRDGLYVPTTREICELELAA